MARPTQRPLKQLFYPREVGWLDQRLTLIGRSIIGPYAPETPPLSAQMKVACIGSCFAQELATRLSAQGRSVAPIFLSERWNTAFAMRHFVEYAFEGTPFPPGYAGGLEAEIANMSFDSCATADAFLLTFGLSLCWFNNETGRMVLDIRDSHTERGVMGAISRHSMRQTDVAENVVQIEAVIACIRRHKPTAPIILTLSPIPLLLALTREPVIPANTISKAILRAAIHQVSAQPRENVFYWPSYEIVEWMGQHEGPVWGQDGGDLRHLAGKVPDEIMTFFSELYFAAP